MASTSPSLSPTGPNSGQRNSSIFSELNGLVYEYLNITGMTKTMASFQTECHDKSLPCAPKEALAKSTFTQADSNQLLESFDTGDMSTFIQKWTLFLSHIHITSDDMKKLEVYLYVYFGLWPRANNLAEDRQVKAMATLKAYFEENSAELSKDSTILPLFALPFIHDPKQHPVFQELMEEVWSERLRTQLEATLLKYFELLQENIGHHSKLAAVVLRAQHGSKKSFGPIDATIQYHQDRFFQLMTTYRKVRKLLRGTRESYGKLLKVSNEMVTGLEEAVNGTVDSLEPTMQKCYAIFPELFTPDLPSNGKPDKEYFKKLAGAAIFNNILDSDVSLFFIGISDLGPESLNYPKIKETLVSDQVSQSQKLCLLQSLRWLLTKTFPKCREYAMEAFTGADLLGLNAKTKEYRNKLFACMVTQTPTYMKECFARLLNSFASIKIGRSYLASSTHTLDVLVTALVTCKSDNESYICQMIIATLQKLSLRKEMRLGMIERKVIQWLAVYLKAELAKKQVPSSVDNGNNMEVSYNPYLMEYGWALLMNLCLHEEAKPASAAFATDILTSVVQMLFAKPTPDVAPYVVSTLYSLLRNPEVFNIAKRMCLHDTLTQIVGNSKTEMAHHLRKLIEVLSTKGHDRITTTGEVDYDDDDNADPEEFEPELEVSECWTASLDAGSHIGDDLLVREYLLHRELVLPETPQQKNQIQSVHTRPTTPKSFSLAAQSPITQCQPVKSSRHVPTPSRRESLSKKPFNTSAERFATAQSKRNENAKRKIQNSETSKPAFPPKPASPIPSQAGPSSNTAVSGGTGLKSKLKSTGSNEIGVKKVQKTPPTRFEQPAVTLPPLGPEKQNVYYNGSVLMNLVKGNYKNFDAQMFTDDIFASVPQPPHQILNSEQNQQANNVAPPSTNQNTAS